MAILNVNINGKDTPVNAGAAMPILRALRDTLGLTGTKFGCSVAKATNAAGLNVPVRTLWSRKDDIKGGHYRPMHVHHAELGFDAQGKFLAWDHVIIGQSIAAGTLFEGMKERYDLPMRRPAWVNPACRRWHQPLPTPSRC